MEARKKYTRQAFKYIVVVHGMKLVWEGAIILNLKLIWHVVLLACGEWRLGKSYEASFYIL